MSASGGVGGAGSPGEPVDHPRRRRYNREGCAETADGVRRVRGVEGDLGQRHRDGSSCRWGDPAEDVGPDDAVVVVAGQCEQQPPEALATGELRTRIRNSSDESWM